MVKNPEFISILRNFRGEIKCFKKNNSGEPCHASVCGEDTLLQDFDIEEYFKN